MMQNYDKACFCCIIRVVVQVEDVLLPVQQYDTIGRTRGPTCSARQLDDMTPMQYNRWVAHKTFARTADKSFLLLLSRQAAEREGPALRNTSLTTSIKVDKTPKFSFYCLCVVSPWRAHGTREMMPNYYAKVRLLLT